MVVLREECERHKAAALELQSLVSERDAKLQLMAASLEAETPRLMCVFFFSYSFS